MDRVVGARNSVAQISQAPDLAGTFRYGTDPGDTHTGADDMSPIAGTASGHSRVRRRRNQPHGGPAEGTGPMDTCRCGVGDVAGAERSKHLGASAGDKNGTGRRRRVTVRTRGDSYAHGARGRTVQQNFPCIWGAERGEEEGGGTVGRPKRAEWPYEIQCGAWGRVERMIKRGQHSKCKEANWRMKKM